MKKHSPKIQIAIADDHKVVRDSICFCIKLLASKKYEVVINVEDGQKLFEELKRKKAEVLFLDLQMPNINGEATCTELKKEFPGLKVIIFTSHRGWAEADQLIRAGARGFITKDYGHEQLFEAVEEVMKGKIYLRNPDINYYENVPEKKKLRLIKREKHIIKLLSKGLRTADIADELGLSKRTVEGTKTNLFKKTDTRNSAELINYVRAVGW